MTKQKKKYIIANWKMKLGQAESLTLAKEVKRKYRDGGQAEMVLCPTATALAEVGKILAGSKIKLGAQNIFYHDSGAYTGQISPKVAREIGCEYAIIGHSERRKLGETDEDVNRKVEAALKNNLIPIVCVGETFREYEEKKTEVVIIGQVTRALEDISLKEGQKIIIAYEPVWVIGSGQAVDHGIFQHIVQIIVHTAVEMGAELADKFEVIYGGSVDEENVREFIVGNISTGVIVGNNSLEADKLIKIVENINEL
ncbi:triose-phosphate isomerase [Candidatus Kuenenbacteria bacterium]|nr:triose-phosphate isomerase [Candidatus Kuenenbacteria bacterium]